MYLLGCGDLVARNIGLTVEGKICLFDLERVFFYQNKVLVEEGRLVPSFVSQAFDWPQYAHKLDAKDVCAIRALQEQLRAILVFWPQVSAYFSLYIEESAFLERVEKVVSFPVEEGSSFYDFYCWIEPAIAPYLSDLAPIAEKIYKRAVGHGSILMMLTRSHRTSSLSKKDKEEVKQWIQSVCGIN